MESTNNLWGVALSITIAVLASYVALDLADRVRSRQRGRLLAWKVGGAFVMGSGIWAMHFIGMLSFALPVPLGYSLGHTVASWLAAVFVSGLALQIASRPQFRWRTLAVGALLMGAGICAMHYLGMSALQMAPGIVWNAPLVAASVLIACAASAAALFLVCKLPPRGAANPPRPNPARAAWMQPLAALAMGAAISGMHYTAMAAASFPAGSVCLSAGGLGGTSLGALVVLAAVALLAVALLTAAQDVRMQAQSARLVAERSARESADAANSAKTNFLARMSHELRTPLNAIHGFAELLLLEQGRADAVTQRQRLELIVQSSRHLGSLIDDLLDVSRIELGALDVHVVSTEAGGIVRAAITELAERAARAEVSVAFTWHKAHAWAMADPVRLHQVASNLLSNAIKYNRRGGSVHVTLAAQDEWIVLAVADAGDGLSRAQLAELFQPFNRLGRSPHQEGTGIGLVITRHLVQSMGGRIDVDSTPGEGSTFTVRLRCGSANAASPAAGPAVIPAANPAIADTADPAPAEARPLARDDVHGLLLYIEDDAVNQVLMQGYIGLRPGVRLRIAGSAGEGMQQAAAERPDLILVDMTLPDGSGLQLAPRLDALFGARCPPLVAFSANAMEADVAAALDNGFSDYLVKPAPTRAVLALVDRFLAAAGADSTPAALTPH